VPLAVNAVYLANPELPDLSQTPLAFSVTAVVFGWGFFRFRLFKVSPLALKAAFDAVGDAVIVVDRERRVAELNPMARTLLDPQGLEEPLGQPVEAALTAAGVDGVVLGDRLRRDLSSRDGRRLETDIRAIRDRRDAGIRGWIVILRDVTDQRRAEEGLRESEAMVRSVLERSPIGILRLTPLRNSGGRIRDFTAVLANPTAEEALVGPGDSLVGRTLTDVRPPHTPVLMDALRRVMRSGDPEEMVIQVESPDAAPRWLRLNATPVGADVSLTFVDITDERIVQAEMSVAAHTDPLTGLLNRRGLAKDGEKIIASARAERRPLAVVYLDLDDFKDVNDQHGHGAGDTTLREFALRVQSCLRAEDVLARVGGDEFVIILQDPGPGTEDDVAHRVDDALASPVLVIDALGSPREIALRYSMGTARLSPTATDLATLLRTADAGMYRSKDQRRIPSGE
jgi:diguanylate cyclase (GGDEF)-like protein